MYIYMCVYIYRYIDIYITLLHLGSDIDRFEREADPDRSKLRTERLAPSELERTPQGHTQL